MSDNKFQNLMIALVVVVLFLSLVECNRIDSKRIVELDITKQAVKP